MLSNNSTIKHTTTINSIQLSFSSTIQLSRHFIHVIIVILFISIITFVNHKHNYSRMTSIRPFSQLSRFIVSIGIIGLVLNDLLVVNGVIHQIWCFLHQLFLHLLLITIVIGHVLPDICEYTNQYSHRCGIIFSFIILLVIQLFISMQWLKNHNNSSNIKLNLPILCLNSIRPQILIFIVHLLHLIFTIQSICTPIILDDTNSISSVTIYINEKFCQLYSILVRLFYFTGTSILHIFFLPGQFSGTLYSGILVIEIVLKYLIIVYHSNVRYERNIADRNNNTPYLSLKNDDLNDDTRLLNNID